MAITVANLLAPVGPVELRLFPGENVIPEGDIVTKLEARLQTYVDQATVKVAGVAFTQPDPAILSWALHLTFKAAYLIACSRPANENSMVPVLGSEGFAKDQRDALLALANQYFAEYEGLAAAVTVATQPSSAQSRTTPLIFEW